jgi:hypothetical protein
MTPEGYVVILVLAGPSDDHVCSRALAYTRSLHELKLDIVVGCQGGRSFVPASAPEAAEELLIDAVWESADASLDELRADAMALLDYCHETTRGIKVSKVLVFCSGDRLSNAVESRKIADLAGWLNTQDISPVFCLTAPTASQKASSTQKTSLVTQWFMLPDRKNAPKLSPTTYHDFLSGCLQKQWEVFV